MKFDEYYCRHCKNITKHGYMIDRFGNVDYQKCYRCSHEIRLKENPRSRFRQLYQIKDSHGRVHSVVGGLKLAKSHAQRFADMFDETMRIESYKWRG